ncbi:photosystem I assembly protein Ycf4 [Lyngbya confervoides]|uniref:Photosystem I assembly protein Ycf4 n=1 Tax=Lyngbya confervoides BDU141951 TaxID=1574623 RepID=A0ABD4T015_9CYAN|nr:photosystem I assembly protein Ycf4 [Lyngbya confervoides]MCM1981730.1 photosystem I assembly protein Ycf4 [Lyngbya confervoides BDU141951]
MTAQLTENESVLRYRVLGSKRFSNIWWASIISIGSVGFLLAGLSSYFHRNLLPIGNATDLIFIPQGIAMTFYGIAGSLLATYLWLTVIWDVGSGTNEFDKRQQQVRLRRCGYPGKNRQVNIHIPFADVQAVRVDIREGLNPKRALYLKVKGKGDYPLTRVGQPIALATLENQAAEIARFLNVPMEGL